MKKVEEMTVNEMREFAAKASITIPDKLTKKKDILAFLKDDTKQGPSEKNAAAKELERLSEVETQQKTRLDEEKLLLKEPLSEAEKVKLAQLETLARSGKSPDIDQMKELGMLRRRKPITPLSPVEERELEELEIKAQGGETEAVKDSGLPIEERLSELRKRSKIK